MTLKFNGSTPNPQQSLSRIEYVSQMLVELKSAAVGENEQLLAYLVEMAYIESCDIIAARKKSAVKVSDGNKPPGMSM